MTRASRRCSRPSCERSALRTHLHHKKAAALAGMGFSAWLSWLSAPFAPPPSASPPVLRPAILIPPLRALSTLMRAADYLAVQPLLDAVATALKRFVEDATHPGQIRVCFGSDPSLPPALFDEWVRGLSITALRLAAQVCMRLVGRRLVGRMVHRLACMGA